MGNIYSDMTNGGNYTIKDGYVIYDHAQRSWGHWVNMYKRAKQDFSTTATLKVKDYTSMGQHLKKMAQSERTKERKLLYKVFGIMTDKGFQDEMFYLKKFNEILTSKEDYENILRILDGALKHQSSKDKTAFRGQRVSKERSPMVASYFSSYLEKNLTKQMQNFATTKGMQASEAEWREAFQTYFERAVDAAFMEMSQAKEKYADGDQVWIKLGEFYQKNEKFRQSFRDKIGARFANPTMKLMETKRREGKKSVSGTAIKKAINITEKTARTLGGHVQEFITDAFKDMNVEVGKGGSVVLSSDMAKTDSISIYSAVGEVDLSLLYQLDEEISGSSSLAKTRGIIKNYYDQHLRDLDDNFIVYTSTKSYALTQSFSGFHGGGSQPLTSAGWLLERLNKSDTEKTSFFFKQIYNTINGAIAQDQQKDYIEELKRGISEAMAYLLFDDWYEIGTGVTSPANSIHLFSLDGLQIPLSYFLNALADAMISLKPEDIIRVSVKLPSIIYEEGNSVQGEDWQSQLEERFEEQRKAAKVESTYSMVFMKNFKDIVRQLINQQA